MRIQLQDGRVLQGTPLQIVKAMHDLAIFAHGLTVTEYVAWVVEATLAS